jgi:hypothetical protein
MGDHVKSFLAPFSLWHDSSRIPQLNLRTLERGTSLE